MRYTLVSLSIFVFFLQEDRTRVEIFREYSIRKHEPICGQFLNLLNGSDGFIINMTARIIAKVACWGAQLMEQKDLQFYLTWLKDQLTLTVSFLTNTVDY